MVPAESVRRISQVRRILALGSSVGVRIFAVAILVVGVSAGFYAGSLKKADQVSASADRTTIAVENDADRRDLAAAKSTAGQAQVDADIAERARTSRAEASRKQRAAAAAKAKADADKKKLAEGGAAGGDAPPIPSSCGEYSGNRAIGCALLSWGGYQIDQMPCLSQLWEKESGWSTSSTNPAGTAWGIPQALPGNKMKEYGSDWKTNPVVQIKWGLKYIKGRYGDPCGAWDHFQSNNWY